MSQPTYKLYYFDIRGRAELIRILFAYGGIEYEDVRVAREDWPALKPTLPFGQMPVLEVDGKRVFQSIPIARYVAKRVGLAGDNDWESLLIDVAVDTVMDFYLKIADASDEKKSELVPFYLDKLESIAEENDGHLAAGKLTWADVYFFTMADAIKTKAGADVLADRPNLQSVISNVSSVESIKDWIERRPKTAI